MVSTKKVLHGEKTEKGLKKILTNLGGEPSVDDCTCDLLDKIGDTLDKKYNVDDIYITEIDGENNILKLNKLLKDGVYIMSLYEHNNDTFSFNNVMFAISSVGTIVMVYDDINGIVLRVAINPNTIVIRGLNSDDFPMGTLEDFTNPEDYSFSIRKIA